MAGQTNNTDILEGINQVVQAINDLELTSICNCGCTGGATIQPPPSTNTPADEVKCNGANAIWLAVSDYYDVLAGFEAQYSGGNYEETGNAAFDWVMFRLIYAFAAISGMVSDVAGWVAKFLITDNQPVADMTAVFAAVRDAWLAETSIVCELYAAVDTVEAKALIEMHASQILSGLSFSTEQNNLVLDVTTALLTNEFINPLFDGVSGITPSVDCAGCGGSAGIPLFVRVGLYTPPDEFTTVKAPNVGDDYDRLELCFNVTAETFVNQYGAGVTVTELTLIAGTHNIPPGGRARFQITDDTGTTTYQSNTAPTLPINNVSRLHLQTTSAAMTYRIRYE